MVSATGDKGLGDVMMVVGVVMTVIVSGDCDDDTRQVARGMTLLVCDGSGECVDDRRYRFSCQ